MSGLNPSSIITSARISRWILYSSTSLALDAQTSPSRSNGGEPPDYESQSRRNHGGLYFLWLRFGQSLCLPRHKYFSRSGPYSGCITGGDSDSVLHCFLEGPRTGVIVLVYRDGITRCFRTRRCGKSLSLICLGASVRSKDLVPLWAFCRSVDWVGASACGPPLTGCLTSTARPLNFSPLYAFSGISKRPNPERCRALPAALKARPGISDVG